MDITCAKCGEPWDNFHMREDAIKELGLPDAVTKNWDGKLYPMLEMAFESDGWKFIGHCIYAIAQCPACKDRPTLPYVSGNIQWRQVLVEIMGDDVDGIISEINDNAHKMDIFPQSVE